MLHVGVGDLTRAVGAPVLRNIGLRVRIGSDSRLRLDHVYAAATFDRIRPDRERRATLYP
jgi:hypothetical protein